MKEYRVKPGTKVDLDKWDPADKGAMDTGKRGSLELMNKFRDRMWALQDMLYAQHQHKILIVLQGMDTSGKDGTIRSVFYRMDPQGIRVANFKTPTPPELDRDYLWRIHQQVPGKGQIVIFNRSHYEDVLIVRVHKLVPKDIWSKRYDHINDFERMLTDEGSTILKLFLHISSDEQRKRLQARIDRPYKHWKFSTNDLEERKLWPEYTKAYEDVLSKTSTEWAPWYIIPSNRKWYRNLVVANIIVEAMEDLKMEYPTASLDLDKLEIK